MILRMRRLHRLSCGLVVVLAVVTVASAEDWPQWLGPRRDGVWREEGIVDVLPQKLDIVWRREIGGGYAGPAVADGRVFVTDRVLEKGESNPEDPFSRQGVQGKERLHCLDAKSGKALWRHEWPSRYEVSYPVGPRATPTVSDGKVWTLGAMGDFFCLDAKSGDVIWAKSCVEDLGAEINVWGTSAAPLVDGKQVILLAGGRPDACVVAFDRDTGKTLWRALDEPDPGYCPPIIVEAGGTRQLIVWTPTRLSSLDPQTGRVHWSEPFEVRSSLSISTPIHDPERSLLLVTSFYNGSMMMRLARDRPAAELVWKGSSSSERKTDGLHSIMCTPGFRGAHFFGVCSYGQLRCLESETGARVWETLEATGSGRWWNAFIVPQGDRYFIANEQGELLTAELSSRGFKELSRTRLIEPTNRAQRRQVVWSHPAFANRCVYARNDREIVCVDLSQK